MDIYNTEGRFISMLSDYGFKVTFGNEADTTFLRKALQALIDTPIPIKHIEFTKNELAAITKDSRSGIYDIACVDEADNYFIVEMQLSDYKEFIQRMKFYGLHRFNTFVQKGEYQFEHLPKIYCIGILATNIFPHITDYHNVAVLRNAKNEIIDDQMTFITVELAKFQKLAHQIVTDLEKLLYTMKNLHQATEITQFPQFWTEEWLKKAIAEVDLRNLTPEQKLHYEMTISANALVLKNEKKKLQEAKAEGEAIGEARGKAEAKKEFIKISLDKGLDIAFVAELYGVSVEYVMEIQQQQKIV